ncbi:MAG TPA: helix-turn-helix transcriptional regulator [Rhizomicrobium sp.]|jgi:transcriptional regulator with XRE-family HTH domain
MIGERIAELRNGRGLTQPQLAQRLHTSPVQISRLENNQRKATYDWLKRIADALDVKVSDLLPDEDVADRLSETERSLLAELRADGALPPTEMLAMVRALNNFVQQQASRRVTRGALPGDPTQVALLADAWAELSADQRNSALDMIRAAARIAPGYAQAARAA